MKGMKEVEEKEIKMKKEKETEAVKDETPTGKPVRVPA